MVQFFVHHPDDHVGVAVTDIAAGDNVEGWNMETGGTLSIVALNDIPLGHKIATKPLKAGKRLLKYGVPIGVVTRDIAAGEHVHVHNLKTARWDGWETQSSSDTGVKTVG